MKQWGEYDEAREALGKQHPNILCYLPENFISDILESFTEILVSSPRSYKTLSNECIL
jgi:hypothetical protein